MARKSTLRQVAALSSSSFVLRAMGMAFRIYLGQRMGTAGLGLNQLVMSVYMFATLICSQGLSSAVLRLCAERPSCAKAIALRASRMAALLGLALGAAMFFGALPLSRGPLEAESLLPLRLLAPALPLTAVSSCLRGYFLSQSQAPKVTACQFIEQIFRILLAILLLESHRGADVYTLCCLQLLAMTIGELVSLACYALFFLRAPKDGASPPPGVSGKLCRVALPILLATLVQSGMQTVENLLIPPLLRLSGSKSALEEYGLLSGMVMPVLFFPAAIPSAILTVQLPAAVRLTAQGKKDSLRAHLRKSLGVSIGFSLFCAALFCGLAQPLMQTLYHNEDAGSLLFLLAPLLPALYLDRLADGLLKSLGRQRAALWMELGDSLLRLGLLFVLVPRLGLHGLLVITAVSACAGCLCRMKCLLRACDCGKGALLRSALCCTPSVLGGAAALLVCLLCSSLPLPAYAAGLLGLTAGSLSFFLLYCLGFLLARGRTCA